MLLCAPEHATTARGAAVDDRYRDKKVGDVIWKSRKIANGLAAKKDAATKKDEISGGQRLVNTTFSDTSVCYSPPHNESAVRAKRVVDGKSVTSALLSFPESAAEASDAIDDDRNSEEKMGDEIWKESAFAKAIAKRNTET